MSSTSPRIESSHGELCRKAPFTASNFKCVEDRLQTTLFTFETTQGTEFPISNIFPFFSVHRHLASFSCADEVMYNSSKQCFIIRVNNVTVQLRVCMFRLEQDSSETYFSPGNIHLNFANWFTKKMGTWNRREALLYCDLRFNVWKFGNMLHQSCHILIKAKFPGILLSIYNLNKNAFQ